MLLTVFLLIVILAAVTVMMLSAVAFICITSEVR